MPEVNTQYIITGCVSFLDQAARAIADDDQVAAINSLSDALNAIKTLEGILKLPRTCTERNLTNEKAKATG